MSYSITKLVRLENYLKSDMAKLFVVSVVIFLAAIANVGAASSLTVYGTVDCSSKKSLTLSSCGCNSVPFDYHKGYEFTYNGQTAKAYEDDKCSKDASVSFSGNAQNCKFFTWKSVFIQCSSPPPPPSPMTSSPPAPPPSVSPPPPPPVTPPPPPPPNVSTRF